MKRTYSAPCITDSFPIPKAGEKRKVLITYVGPYRLYVVASQPIKGSLGISLEWHPDDKPWCTTHAHHNA